MLENNTGRIVGVNGNMLTVEFETAVTQNEVAFAVPRGRLGGQHPRRTACGKARHGRRTLSCKIRRVRKRRIPRCERGVFGTDKSFRARTGA